MLNSGEYGSEFEYDSEEEKKRQRRRDLAEPQKSRKTKVANKRELEDEYGKEHWKITRLKVLSLDAFSRHKKLINDYLVYYGGNRAEFKRDASLDKTDMDIVRENHRFLWDDDDHADDTWEKRMAKKYYDKLFKEYCICDLSRYKENKVAMRWRIEKEVVDGKGQFVCGEKRCNEFEGLRSWEVNFAYQERGERKNALVKLRLCPDCSYKLNYRSKKREVTRKRKARREEREDEETAVKKAKGEPEEADDNRTKEGEPSTSRAEADTGSTSSRDPAAPETDGAGDSMWAGPAKITEEKSRDEEFDDYFEDMFL